MDGKTMTEKGKILPTQPTNDPEVRHDAVNHQNPMEEEDVDPIAHPAIRAPNKRWRHNTR